MGQAKQRKSLEPRHEKLIMLKELIEKNDLYEDPEQVFVTAFRLLAERNIVIIDSFSYNHVIALGFNLIGDLPTYLDNNKPMFRNVNYETSRALVLSPWESKSMVMIIPILEIKKGINWANQEGVKLRKTIKPVMPNEKQLLTFNKPENN